MATTESRLNLPLRILGIIALSLAILLMTFTLVLGIQLYTGLGTLDRWTDSPEGFCAKNPDSELCVE